MQVGAASGAKTESGGRRRQRRLQPAAGSGWLRQRLRRCWHAVIALCLDETGSHTPSHGLVEGCNVCTSNRIFIGLCRSSHFVPMTHISLYIPFAQSLPISHLLPSVVSSGV